MLHIWFSSKNDNNEEKEQEISLQYRRQHAGHASKMRMGTAGKAKYEAKKNDESLDVRPLLGIDG